jgi:rhodanese-related sulfurtransferase/mannose-6-phosphate isomerase-like protein (cupin superfamily)
MAVGTERAHEAEILGQAGTGPVAGNCRTPDELAMIVERTAALDDWIGRVRLCGHGRWYERIYDCADYDLWVISWMPGQSTGFHDHGSSSGAFVVATGVLEELRPDGRSYGVTKGEARSFGPDYAHDVRNASEAPAISIHAYSPPLTEMNEYEIEGAELILRNEPRRQDRTLHLSSRARTEDAERETRESRVDRRLAAARARLRRLAPVQAREALAGPDTVLVDIRPEGQRATEGTIPGALIVERNVLEWRFDPGSPARLPTAIRSDLQVIVFCSEGYASSLAAADLHEIGLWRATDIIGGFQAWKAMGLPTETRAGVNEG